jgi:hypothetical protein
MQSARPKWSRFVVTPKQQAMTKTANLDANLDPLEWSEYASEKDRRLKE